MGGAVQSFSSPMLAQGMQGGLSGFGTSGLGTFADGGQTTTIQDILAKYKAMESAKVNQDPTTEFLNKSWEGKNIDDYVMYSDKYKKGGKMAHGGVIQHGLQEGDKIVKEVDNKYLIVASKGGVYSVVNIEKGSRFIVGLDDSKTSGKRKSVKAGVKEAMDYINYIKSTKMANGGKFAQGGMLEDAKIYVADLAEYNNGRLVGKWLELSDYSSGAEVMEAIQEMLDEQTKKDKFGDIHEEYAIHDYEGFPRSFYSEYMGESDFDELYEIAKIADSSNLPIDVLMEAVSDLGYEDNPERVAEAYYSSIPASMGNEWRDFAYEYIDSIGSITEAVSKPEYYFDFENFGSDVRMDYSEEELEEMGYNDLSDEELGEQMADEMGGVKYLGEKLIETYFDYEKFGSELEYDFIAVRGKDGNFYFFNRNFAKGGKVSENLYFDQLAGMSGTRAVAVKEWASSNNLSQDDLMNIIQGLGRKQITASEFVGAVLGDKTDTSMIISYAKSGKGFKMAKGGEVKNTIDILMTEEPKVWDKFSFFSGSEIRASKDKTKKYAQELERVFTAKGVKKGSLTKKINENLTDENYHLLNEFLTRNGYFNSKLTDELLKSYNNPVYSGAYADKDAMTIEEKAKAKTSGVKKIQLKKLSAKTTYIPNREIGSIELESGETLSKNDIIDGVYRAKKKYAKGGKVSSQKIYEVEYEIGGKKHTSEYMMYDWERVENKFPPETKIISIKEKFAKGGEVVSEIESKYALAGKDSGGVWTYSKITADEIAKKYKGSVQEDGSKWYVSLNKFAKGGKIGFEGLAKKVAKRYVGKKVSKEYQAEYGKTYDAKEAKEVGNKVAGKVYQQQVAKKKIVRKLQRKTN